MGTRSGAEVSTKQLALAARQGRRVHFFFSGKADPIVGYVAGLDDFHVKVVAPGVSSEGDVLLIHKTAPDYIRVEGRSSYDDTLKVYPWMDAIVGPYREALTRGNQT